MILQRYIFRQIVLSFLFTFAIIMGVFLIVMCFQVFRSYSSLGTGIFLRILPLAACNAAAWAILLSTCPAVTLVYGRLSADNEIDAMRISGIATRRVVTPALFFSLFICAANYGVVNHLSPAANFARRMVLREFSTELLKAPPPGKQHFPIGRFVLSYLDASDGVLQLPYVTKYGADGKPEIEYTALSGRLVVSKDDNPQIVMAGPTAIQHDADGKVTLLSASNEVPVELPMDTIITSDPRGDNLDPWELWAAIQKETRPQRLSWLRTIFWSRFGQSLAPFVLVLIAVPFGILVRRGSRLAGLGAALPPLLVYLFLFFVFRGMGDNGRVSPVAAGFVPSAILLLLGSGLLWKVCRK